MLRCHCEHSEAIFDTCLKIATSLSLLAMTIFFMNNFWTKLNSECKKAKRPILALAPMAGITDSPFRQICKDFGADVVYSEMASTAALFFNPGKTLEMLVSDKKESPYVIQLFGSNPEHFAHAVKLLTATATSSKFQVPSYIIPSGIDINFGCPVKKVAKQGAGAALMNNIKLAREIIQATISNTSLPVSIKIRSQVGAINALQFLDKLNDLDIKTVMIHGRTLNQGHSGPVDFETIRKARNYFGGIILANGGVKNLYSAKELFDKTEADGIGIGQEALGRPWIFKQLRINNYELRIKELNKIIIKHAKLVEKMKGELGMIEFRKHLCWYVSGLPGAKELRQKFIKINDLKEVKEILKK